MSLGSPNRKRVPQCFTLRETFYRLGLSELSVEWRYQLGELGDTLSDHVPGSSGPAVFTTAPAQNREVVRPTFFAPRQHIDQTRPSYLDCGSLLAVVAELADALD